MDKFRKHEIMDRLHCMVVQFDEIMPSDDQDEWGELPEEVQSALLDARDALARAYQSAGEWRFEGK